MRITVIAHPNAKKPRVETGAGAELHVYVSPSPHEGKANDAVVRAVAEHFGVAKSCVAIVRGEHSKQKILSVIK